MNKLILITSSSLRHLYFAKTINDFFKGSVSKIYIESTNDINYSYITDYKKNSNINVHFNQRHNSEVDFFSGSELILEKSNIVRSIQKGAINDEKIISEIEKIKPDLILTYGCSIIREPLLELFKKRIINVHLGLSPYYLGAGTNFHALLNNEFHFFGYSIIYMDNGIDTGEIIHQSRANFFSNDTPHTIGNRLIKKMVNDLIVLLNNFKNIKKTPKIATRYIPKVFKIKDCNSDAIKNLHQKFSINLELYIKERDIMINRFPIIRQKFNGL